MKEEIVQAAAFSKELYDSIARTLHSYTVAFVDPGEPERGRMPRLIGSGTLVRAGDRRAILTAHHVLRAVPQSDRLCILLEKTPEPHTLDRAGVHFLKIAYGSEDESTGPDLGAVLLAEQLGGSIEAKKCFCNLEKWVDSTLQSPHDLDVGIWAMQGFLDERTVLTLDPDGRGSTTGFYNYTEFCRPQPPFEVGAFDYFDVRVDNPDGRPTKWGGMSGGGLWQVPLRRDGDGFTPLNWLLSGVAFYQHSEPADGIRCHGRRSLYQVARDAIAQGQQP
jgi:hypothetical protein